VVFAPFYRLVHDSDGSAECHNASFGELLTDVTDAFNWVQQNSESYGATGKPVVFGQSAGGHLAAYLAVQYPAEVERAALFYAPTDFSDFGGQIQRGEYTNNTGISIMRRVTGKGGPVPYDFNTASVSRSFACDDRGSQLYLIAEGEHTLDLCLSDELCFAGSPASAAATGNVIQQMLNWASADDVVGYAPGAIRVGVGGGGFGVLFLCFLPFACRGRRAMDAKAKTTS